MGYHEFHQRLRRRFGVKLSYEGEAGLSNIYLVVEKTKGSKIAQLASKLHHRAESPWHYFSSQYYVYTLDGLLKPIYLIVICLIIICR